MLRPLNTKIDEVHYELLERMHVQSAVPKSKLIERSLELYAKQLQDTQRGLELLRDIETAHDELERGDTVGMDVIDAILRKAKARKRK